MHTKICGYINKNDTFPKGVDAIYGPGLHVRNALSVNVSSSDLSLSQKDGIRNNSVNNIDSNENYVPSNWNDYQKIKDSVPNVKRFSIDVDHPVQQTNASLDIKMIIRNAINQRWVPDNNGKHGKKQEEDGATMM